MPTSRDALRTVQIDPHTESRGTFGTPVYPPDLQFLPLPRFDEELLGTVVLFPLEDTRWMIVEEEPRIDSLSLRVAEGAGRGRAISEIDEKKGKGQRTRGIPLLGASSLDSVGRQ
jgi:hypothetical protein